MSRVTKWKLEKTKVKVVFRLQFHATHIPQTGWDKLFISFIPADSGKATAKTTKANVRNGTCKWADPIYETTRLLQDAKTKQYEEKLYKLVAMGTSRSSFLGEANINIADYVDALKPTVVALPLHGSDSGATLHVTIQLLTSKTGFREFEQQRELSERGLQTTSEHGGGKLPSSADAVTTHVDKAKSRVRFKSESKELPSLEEEVGISEEYSDSAAGFDGSSNTSESLYAEKLDTSSAREVDSVKSTAFGDLGGVSLSQSLSPEKGVSSDKQFVAQGTCDWVHNWGPECSVDSGSGIIYEENYRLQESLEAAELSLHELKQEVSSLQSVAHDIGAQAQNLTEQLANEIATGKELATEVSILKSDCVRLKDDLEALRNSKMNVPFLGRKATDTIQCDATPESNVRWLKGLTVLENKIRELQKKAYPGSHGKDFTFLHLDLEALIIFLQDLRQQNGQAVSELDILPAGRVHSVSSLPQTDDFGMEPCHPEGVLMPGLVGPETEPVDAAKAMQGEILKLLQELDESKAERESIARKMDQMECYYEALIQELEENQKQILGELQNLRNEHSSCMYTSSAMKAQTDVMRHDMEKQLLRLAEEKHSLDTLNKELKRRAVASEAALRRARLNYSIAVNQLQKDLEVLSLQVLSMYETNESLIRKAFPEPSQPGLQGDTKSVLRVSLNAEHAYSDKFMACLNHNGVQKNQISSGDKLLKDLKKSLTFQEELYWNIEEELCEMYLVNINMDIFSLTLRQALLEAFPGMRLMKAEMHDLAKQLELSTKSNGFLKLQLQTAMNDIGTLKEEKGVCIAKCNELLLENGTLEDKLRSISEEKCTLLLKIADLESLVTECSSYRCNYEASDTDKAQLAKLLDMSTIANAELSNEISLLREELRTTKTEFHELSSSKEALQKISDNLRERLASLLMSYNEKFGKFWLVSVLPDHSLDSMDMGDIASRLEDLQCNVYNGILQLNKEKKDFEDECDVAHCSLKSRTSELEVIKQKVQQDIPAVARKLDEPCALLGRLQAVLEVQESRFKATEDAEERCLRVNEDLLADFARMEMQLQELTSKNEDLAKEISVLGSVSDELGSNNLIVEELTLENLNLKKSEQEKINESAMLVLELCSLKKTLRSMEDELLVARGVRDELDAKVLNLVSELSERHEKLIHFDQQQAELISAKQFLLDLESEKSRACHELSNLEEHLKRAQMSSYSIYELETQVQDLHVLLIAADVRRTVTEMQCEGYVENLLEQLESSHMHLQDRTQKMLDLSTMLDRGEANKADYVKENAKLLSTIDHLRSELGIYVARDKAIMDSISVMEAKLEESEKRRVFLESSYARDNTEKAFEIEHLKSMFASSEKEIDDLMISKEELEIRFLVLRADMHEQCAMWNLQVSYNDELVMLKNQHNELRNRLSEQILKTEEFKNLSIHLKELKDKADAELLQARGKREAEIPSVAVQESLRIAFIKEQYETKLQEVRHQLSISKRHGEELLWNLQDALDELENRKKAEASHLKKIEELSMKILALESELSSVLSDCREKVKAHDQLKAELECSMMSLQCSNEEKKKLLASLEECNEEKSKLVAEVQLMREKLKNSSSYMKIPIDVKEGCFTLENLSSEPAPDGILEENSILNIPSHSREVLEVTGSPENKYPNGLRDGSLVKIEELSMEARHDQKRATTNPEDELALRDRQDNAEQSYRPNDMRHDAKHLPLVTDELKAKHLMSSMDRLQRELERMRSENTLIEEGESQAEPNIGLHREQMHLRMVNEELGNISVVYNDFSRSGNSIERVLALELELAEALQAKKKSSIQFQSSFLKLHSDEAAVFQSFKDINELIKDMLDLKARYGTMETELKEMHDRYSQLSLRFAEVEGERQKLMITLKNVRATKNLFGRSSSAIVGEQSP